MLSPTESTPASWAPRLAASIVPGPPPVITAKPGLAERAARPRGRARTRARRAACGRSRRCRPRGPMPAERLEARAAARASIRRRRSASVRVERTSRCSAQMISSPRRGGRIGGRAAHCSVRFASGAATTFASSHGSIRKTTAAPRRSRRRHRPGARRPARDRAADGRRRSAPRASCASAAEGRPAPPRRSRKAIEIGTRVLESEGTAVERRLRAARARAGPRRARRASSAETLEEGAEALAEQIATSFGADRSDSVQAQIKEIVVRRDPPAARGADAAR